MIRFIIDVESTSLSPDYPGGTGMIWEAAAIQLGDAARVERLWRMRPDLAKADPAALAVGRYYERTAGMCERCQDPRRFYNLAGGPNIHGEHWSDPVSLAGHLARLLNGATLIGAVPSFDASFVGAFLRHHGEAATWKYRLRDIGSMAYGYLSARAAGSQLHVSPGSEAAREYPDLPSAVPPMDASTDDFAVALGVDPGQFERHSALGDCRLVAAMLDVIEGGAQ